MTLEDALDSRGAAVSDAIALENAALCMDCSSVYDTRNINCPSCSSAAAGLISTWLNKEQ